MQHGHKFFLHVVASYVAKSVKVVTASLHTHAGILDDILVGLAKATSAVALPNPMTHALLFIGFYFQTEE